MRHAALPPSPPFFFSASVQSHRRPVSTPFSVCKLLAFLKCIEGFPSIYQRQLAASGHQRSFSLDEISQITAASRVLGEGRHRARVFPSPLFNSTITLIVLLAVL
jgi:hypothetical protein